LATLFSPLVLRYAIPALGLAVIAVIGLTIFRNEEQRATEVAQRSSAPVGSIEQAPSPSQGSGYHGKLEGSKTDPAAEPEAGRTNSSKEPTPAPTALDSIAAPVSASSGVSNAAPAPKPEPQQQVANTPAGSPTPPAATEVAGRKDLQTQKQELDRQVAATTEAQRERAYAQERDENRPAKDPPAAAPTSGAKTTSTLRPGVSLRRQEIREDDAEVRSVSGRRFRKQRGVWVDTAYDSSSATVNLTRGSEQYRALVADEPEIKRIADQLDGEVIVVWKGRAYRIR
jgi:hypothetical protein